MTLARTLGLATLGGASLLLTGCVVAPVDGYATYPAYGGYYQTAPVYAAPAPVVVSPSIGFSYSRGSYYGPRGHYGGRGYYGGRGRYWR